MEEILVGESRRYHIEKRMASYREGDVYRAWSRRRHGRKLVRHYYAVVALPESESKGMAIKACEPLLSKVAGDCWLRVTEYIVSDGRCYAVLEKKSREGVGSDGMKRFTEFKESVYNKGYLMLILAAVILILMIIRYFQ